MKGISYSYVVLETVLWAIVREIVSTKGYVEVHQDKVVVEEDAGRSVSLRIKGLGSKGWRGEKN